eukprot:352763-Chlamydomonas_euryale.AAC.2
MHVPSIRASHTAQRVGQLVFYRDRVSNAIRPSTHWEILCLILCLFRGIVTAGLCGNALPLAEPPASRSWHTRGISPLGATRCNSSITAVTRSTAHIC